MVRGILKLFKPKNSRKTRPTFTEPSEAEPEEYRPPAPYPHQAQTMFRTPKPSFRATVEDASDEDRMTLTPSMMDRGDPYPTARRAASSAPPIQTVPSSQARDRVTVISLPDQSYAGSLLTAGAYDRSHHMNDYGAPSVAPSVTSTRRDDQAHYRTRSRQQPEYVAPPRSTASGEQYAASQVDDREYAESEAPSLLRVPSGAIPLPGLHDRTHRSDSRAAPAASLTYPRHEDEYRRSHKGKGRSTQQHEYAAPPLSTASGEIYATQQHPNDAYARAANSAAPSAYYAQPQASGSAYEAQSRAPVSTAPGEHYAQQQPQYAAGDNAYARSAAPLTTVSGEHYAQQYQMHDPPRAGTSTFPQPLPDSPSPSDGQAAYAYGATTSEVGGGAMASEPSTSWSRSAVFVPRPGSPIEVGGYRVRVEDPRPSSRSTRDRDDEYRDERPESRTSRRSGQSRRSRDTRRYRDRDRDRTPSPDSRYHSRSREPCDCSECRRRGRRDSGPRKPSGTRSMDICQ
ncbi:hypothetical protein AURDEDRAFT_119491 [Auricularia subglabra TFB-10046 SS5]|nr:hypothetical protein AURDEDRAFT_119491 [Auricularia subglabra TFB-10046 SS5]